MWKPPKPLKGKGFGISARDDDVDEELDDENDSSVTEFSIVDPGQELADSLHVDLGWLARCTDLLRDRPQLIFYGPPGTGKTYIAKTLARHLAGPDNVTIVQFHSAYSYEDFFEGFRPSPHSDGQVGFELKPGPMRRLTDRARKHPVQLFVLVVDEINRGNLAKIFFGVVLPARIPRRGNRSDVFLGQRRAVHAATQCGHHRHDEHRGPFHCLRGHGDAPALRARCIGDGAGVDEIFS
ncbi:AAA domain-containing protein [Rhodococcus erythropolis]|nr:AAA domain-containing protein [Rhodococcus erythropolis]